MGLNIENFLTTLPMMLYGMVGIFVVIAVIMLCIFIMSKIFPEKK